MQLQNNQFINNLLNLGVSGASVEDDISIAYMAAKKFQPTTFFIGVDPWLFNLNSGQNRWTTIEQEYIDAMSLLNKSVPKNNNTLVPQSNSMFEAFVGKVYEFSNSQAFEAHNDTPALRAKIRKDGSRI
ncbi:hypothetical protein MCEZE4_00457 [Burkholderiaceae bacterium]